MAVSTAMVAVAGPPALLGAVFGFIGLLNVLYSVRPAIRAVRLLARGVLAPARRTDAQRTNRGGPNRPIYRLMFELDVGGERVTTVVETLAPRSAGDDQDVLALHLRDDPRFASVLDYLPGSPRIQGDGTIAPASWRRAATLLLLPATTLLALGVAVARFA